MKEAFKGRSLLKLTLLMSEVLYIHKTFSKSKIGSNKHFGTKKTFFQENLLYFTRCPPWITFVPFRCIHCKTISMALSFHKKSSSADWSVLNARDLASHVDTEHDSKYVLFCIIICIIFTSLFKNIVKLTWVLAEAFRCHGHHFQSLTVLVELCKNLVKLTWVLAEAFRCHGHHFQSFC